MTARDKWHETLAGALANWHIGCIPPRPDWSIERELFRSGVAEILSLRLRAAIYPQDM